MNFPIPSLSRAIVKRRIYRPRGLAQYVGSVKSKDKGEQLIKEYINSNPTFRILVRHANYSVGDLYRILSNAK